MGNYTDKELTDALRAIDSIIHKCEKYQEKFPEGKTQHTLLRNRLRAMYISKALVTEKLSKAASFSVPQTSSTHTSEDNCNPELLLASLDRLQTTNLGIERIRNNLNLDTDDVVDWCREKIQTPSACIHRKGKNWYIAVDGCEITVNAHSFTIITAHKLT